MKPDQRWRHWRAFWALNGAQRRVLLHSLGLLPLMRIGLWLVGFVRLHRWLAQWATHGVPGANTAHGDHLATARQIAEWVDVAARRGLYHGNCLDQSLTLWWLLQRRGVPAEIRVGVRKAPDATSVLLAHAWVEVAGQAVNDAPDVSSHFAPFQELSRVTLRADG